MVYDRDHFGDEFCMMIPSLGLSARTVRFGTASAPQMATPLAHWPEIQTLESFRANMGITDSIDNATMVLVYNSRAKRNIDFTSYDALRRDNPHLHFARFDAGKNENTYLMSKGLYLAKHEPAKLVAYPNCRPDYQSDRYYSVLPANKNNLADVQAWLTENFPPYQKRVETKPPMEDSVKRGIPLPNFNPDALPESPKPVIPPKSKSLGFNQYGFDERYHEGRYDRYRPNFHFGG
jgi:hypothetical protein